MRVALAGGGTIAGRYVAGLRQTPGFEVTAICSRTGAGARAVAAEHGLAACSLDDILASRTIDYVLNLTPADTHEAITDACLRRGKSVYSEKPLAATVAAADALVQLARSRGLLLACAPATYLWPPMATARRLVAEGQLGPIAGALTTLVYPGPEIFHPHPAHLFGAAAGPLHDIGVYQISALMALLGPVVSVAAMTSRARSERVVKIGPDAGRTFDVQSPTHVHAQLRHAGGAISSVIVSFDGMSARGPRFDLFGQDAGLSLSDFHTPHATLTLNRPGSRPGVIPLDPPAWSDARWAIGPTSAWQAREAGQEIPASAERARDVLAVLCAIDAAAAAGRSMDVVPSAAWAS